MTKEEFERMSGGLSQAAVLAILQKGGKLDRATLHVWAYGRKGREHLMRPEMMGRILRGIRNRHLWWSESEPVSIEEMRAAGVTADEIAEDCKMHRNTFVQWRKSRPNVARALVWGGVKE